MFKKFIDLSGKKFHNLTVIKRVPAPKNSSQKKTAHFLCLCDCGKKIILNSAVIKKQKSCGCKKRVNLIGIRFTKLLVIERAPIPKTRSKTTRDGFYKCLCDCGNIVILAGGDLQKKKNSTKSCGCLRKHNTFLETRFANAMIVYKSYKDGNLIFKEFLYLVKQNCYYCNAPPSNKKRYLSSNSKNEIALHENANFIYNGLDRIDNSKPHDKENVVPCCWICNSMKRHYTLNNFLNKIKDIYENRIIG